MTSAAGEPGPDVRKRASRFWASIDERLGLDAFRYKVPGYANTLPYTLGGLTFFGFIVLVLTGVYLGQFYHPHPTIANDSVRAIILEVPLGAFVRSVHFWTAQAVLVSVALHVTRVFMTAAYKMPREFNWFIGIGLLATAIGLFFTGTVLKWDQEAFEALEHNVEIGALLGAFGSFFSPTFAAQVPLLTRLYSVHVSLLPLIFGALLVAHVFYVRHFGISPRAVPEKDAKEEKYEPFTGHMKKIVVYGVVLFGIVGVLALAWTARSILSGTRSLALAACLAVVGVGLIATGVTRIDVPGADGSVVSSASGMAHELAGYVLLMGLIPAAFLVAATFRRDPRLSSAARPAWIFAGAIIIAFIVAVMSLSLDLIGVGQRIFLATWVAWLIFVAFHVYAARPACFAPPTTILGIDDPL